MGPRLSKQPNSHLEGSIRLSGWDFLSVNLYRSDFGVFDSFHSQQEPREPPRTHLPRRHRPALLPLNPRCHLRTGRLSTPDRRWALRLRRCRRPSPLGTTDSSRPKGFRSANGVRSSCQPKKVAMSSEDMATIGCSKGQSGSQIQLRRATPIEFGSSESDSDSRE